jgi:hypothetical protein
MYLIDITLNQQQVRPYFTDNSVSSLIKDQEGNFWVSTINGGLLMIPNLGVSVKEPHQRFNRLEVLPQEQKLLVGTARSEAFVMDLPTDVFGNVYKGSNNAEMLSMHYDLPQRQLLYSADRLVFVRNGQKVKDISLSVKDMEALNANILVYAATGKTGFIDKTKNDTLKAFDIPSQRFRAVSIDHLHKMIYVAGSKGLWQYSIQTKQIREIKKSDGEGFTSITDLCIVEKPNQKTKLYASSGIDGLFVFENGRFVQQMTTSNGLESNSLYRIKTHKNQVWWLTEKALQCLDTDTQRIRTFSKTDGLTDADMKDIAFANGRVYVATLGGLVSFTENQNDKDSFVPKVVVNAFMTNKKEQNTRTPLKFSYDQNNVDVHLSVIAFKSLESIKVLYQINNQAWVALEKNIRILSLPSLSPDDYILKIKAINQDGVESQEAVLEFTINKPFWNTYMFYALLILAMLMMVSWWYQRREARLSYEAKLKADKLMLEQDLQKSLLTSIKSQMNPHFIFNALNTIQSYIYLNDKQNASSYLVKFSELTRMILDMSNDDLINLRDELKTLRLYLDLEKMRFEDTLICDLSIDEDLDLDHAKIPSMLIQPYIENALKHGLMHKKNERKLWLKFEGRGAFLEVTIEDNGVGRKKAEEINQQKASKREVFALEANQKRIELLNVGHQEQINVQIIDKHDPDGTATGTKVVLRLPIEKNSIVNT